jgi:membrane protein YdbS with pleckstrin-like domain
MELLKPSPRYSIRLYVLITIIAICILVIGIALAWILSADWAHAIHVNQALQAFVILIFLGYLVSLWFAHRYSLSLVYELSGEEIQLQRGIWVQSIQHIPLRSIIGITVRRDFFDRCLEIGTIEFMLGDSLNQKMGAVSLVGLSDVEVQGRKLSLLLLHDWGKSMQMPGASAVDAHSVLPKSTIDIR